MHAEFKRWRGKGGRDNGWSAELTGMQYPLSEKMMRPASNPTYYEGLLKELDEAPKRSWFQSVVNRWKGSLRFS